MSKFFDDIGAEVKRLGTQGSMETANALFNGSAFVPYGPGAYTKNTPQNEQEEAGYEHGQARESEISRETDGMEM